MTVTLNVPALTVQVAFTGTDDSPSWTDISAYVQALSIKRGRNRETDKFAAGTCTLTLKNNDRRFDPEYSAGPYFGDLLPQRPVRVIGTWNAITYPLFRGYTDAWPQAYSVPHAATTVLACTDAFKVLQRSLLDTAYVNMVEAIGPSHWFTLGEPVDSTNVALDKVDGSHTSGTYSGHYTLGQPPMFIGDTTTGVTFDGVTGEMVAGGIGNAAAVSYEFWFRSNGRIPDNGLVEWPLLYAGSGTVAVGGASVYAYIVSGAQPAVGELNVTQTGAGPVTANVLTTIRYDDSVAHHVVVTVSNTTLTMYVDGVSVGSTASAGLSVVADGGPEILSVGGVDANRRDNVKRSFNGTMQHVTVYPAELNGFEVALLHAGANAFKGDSAGTRADRVLSLVGFSTTLRAIDAGTIAVQPMTTVSAGTTTGLDYMQELADTEYGQFYVANDGMVTFRGRQGQFVDARSMTSNATFGDAATEMPYQDLQFDFDDTLLRNYVTGQREGGVQVIVKDATSIGQYGICSDSEPNSLEVTDTELRSKLQYILTNFKNPHTRIAALTLASPTTAQGTTLNARYAQVLGRELGDLVTVKRRPQGVGSAVSVPVVIEGITHDWKASPGGMWTTAWSLSPASTLLSTVLIFDDATRGKLDSTNVLGF